MSSLASYTSDGDLEQLRPGFLYPSPPSMAELQGTTEMIEQDTEPAEGIPRAPTVSEARYRALAETVPVQVTARQLTFLGSIRRCQRHLLGLINGVLDYAKVDAGAVSYKVEDVVLDDVLATCEALVMPEMQAKQLRFVNSGCDATVTAYSEVDVGNTFTLTLPRHPVR